MLQHTLVPGPWWYAELVSLLHLAAHHGWIDIVIDLITKYKCDTNCKDNDGRTPLHYATNNNHLEVVRYFINEQHCDPMTRDNDHDTPLHIACGNDHVHIVQHLLSTGKVDLLAKNKNGKTPMYNLNGELVSLLHLAADHGWMDIVIDLITKYKCDANCEDSYGRTPLHYAARNSHVEVVRYFINEQHCDPMTRDNDEGDTPLHLACSNCHLNIAQYLISEAHCDQSCENNYGDTPLHLASRYGCLNIAQYLISEAHCNPSCENNYGDTPLHLASRYGCLNIAQLLIREAHCNPSCENNYGDTPLHLACRYGHLNIAQYLISEAHCNPLCENNYGEIPLHLAYRNSHFVKYLISEAHCNPSCENNNGDTLLHYACRDGNLNIAQYLITEVHCNPSCENKDGDTPLHLAYRNRHFNIVEYLICDAHCNVDNVDLKLLYSACHIGNINIAKYLIREAHFNPSCENKAGDTPLHYAYRNSHFNIVEYLICEAHCNIDNEGPKLLYSACRIGNINIAKYLISEAHCNPSCKNNDGNTPLHLACRYGHAHIAQYLLSTGKVDPLAKNKFGETPVDDASRHGNNYDLLKLFQSFPQCKRDFPVHTYTKLVLTGYSRAGKTTISQLILFLANKAGFFSWLSFGRVTDVECLTAGIIPLYVESKVNEVGNMVIYDFAGQQEYYSSHAAVLERTMRNSAAIFACIVDLSQCMDKISESIHYWISFIENACSSAQGSSHIIIVGSHADLVKSSQELKEKSSLVESIAESRVKQLTYGGFVSMDCRLSKTKEARHFRSLLSASQQAILSSQPSMSLYSHVLYAFLRTKLEKTGCTLQELTSSLSSEKDFSPNSTVLTELLTSLSDKGLILFVQNQEHPQSSWVVVEKEALLREVNGTLFAPDNFKQYRQVASNTGIVPIATLEELFPQYSSEMLVGCLESMEFCHPVDPSALQATNLKATSSSPPSGANHLFFSSLVKEHRHGDLPSPRVGWCLGCSDPHQFFSNRFLHVFYFDLHSCFLWPASIFHPPPLCVVSSDSVRCGKMESAGRVSLECPL